MLYRLLKDGARFQEVQELAGRDFGRAQFCAGWVGCPRQELAQAGDYVGFAAGWRRLMAAYVLPLGNDPLWRATVYVSRLDLNP